jgi:hypothetical protein
MSNALGAGFGALTLLVLLVGLALLSALTTVVSLAWYRQAGRFPSWLRYPFLLIGVAAVVVAGVGVLTLFDGTPTAAGLFLLLGLLPLFGSGVTIGRQTGATRLVLVVTTVMAWGPALLAGVTVTFGAMGALMSLLDVPAAVASETSLPWIAAAVGGAVVVVAAILLGSRLVDVVRDAGSNPGASHRIVD